MKSVALVLSCLALTMSISVGIEGGSLKCFYLDGEVDQTLTVNYLTSGEGEDNVNVMVLNPQQETVFETFGSKENVFEHTFKMDGEYSVCFSITDNYFKRISFDFDISGEDKNYAQTSQVAKTFEGLTDALERMGQVFRNQHFQRDRETIHQNLIDFTERRVKWCALAKMTVLMVICLVQIYLLTNFFKDKSFGSQV